MIRAFCTLGVGLAVVACGSQSPVVEAAPPAAEATKPEAEATAKAEATTPSMAIPPRKDEADRASKNGVTKGTVGKIPVEVHYGRPSVNGRKVFGELVPYDKVWRTGANEAATLTFFEDAKVEGEVVKAGTYGLFTIPGEAEWTVILNQNAEQWGSFKYDEKLDVARVKTTPEKTEPTETFTIAIDGDKLWLKWAEVGVPIAIGAP